MSGDTAEADAYFESLIARVDQAVAGDASGDGVDGATEASPLWWQLLNYHSAAGLCVRDPFDPFPHSKRTFLFVFGIVLNFFFSSIFTPFGRESAMRTWFFVALAWFPLFFAMRMLLRRPDVSNKFWFYPWGAWFLAACIVLACVIANVLGRTAISEMHTTYAVVTMMISLTSNWAIEVVLLTVCLLGKNPCMRTTVDDRGYLKDAGLLNEDEFGDVYTPPFEEGAKKIPSVVDM
jgi:uncharacterized membrane protein SirB2